MGTPIQQDVPVASGAAVRPIDNSSLRTDDNNAPAAGGNATGGRSGFLGAPSAVPAGVLEGSEPEAVAAPVAAGTAAAGMAAASSSGGYVVQVGALSSAERAQSWQQSLSQQFGVPGKVAANGNVYRVQLGPFSSRQQATQLQQRLASEAQQQSFVTAAP